MSLTLLQPGDDIVFMAQELEKVFMQKIAQMPPEERVVTLNKGKRKEKKPEGKACTICWIVNILNKQKLETWNLP